MTHDIPPIQAEDYLYNELNKIEKPQVKNRLNVLIDMNATLNGNNKPVGMGVGNNKTNEG